MWEKKKKIPTGAGLATAAPSSRNRSFRAPERVITAKSQGTKVRRGERRGENKNPSTTPRGVRMGIARSRKPLRDTNTPEPFADIAIGKSIGNILRSGKGAYAVVY
jgi:hypothetical protein